MKGTYSEEICVELLKKKQEEIRESGETRYPKRADFTNEEVCAIKAFFGPWPRALEAAGLKPERSDGFDEKKKALRIARKRKITGYKKAKAAMMKAQAEILRQEEERK